MPILRPSRALYLYGMADKTRRSAAKAAQRVVAGRDRPMKAVYGLFEDFDGADGALRALQDAGYDTQGAGLIVQAAAAREKRGSRPRPKEAPKPARRRGRPAAPRLGELIARQRPTLVPEAGPVYAGNGMASDLVQAASAENPAMAEAGLKAALQAAGVTQHYAEAYQAGVKNGWLLVMLSVPEQHAFEASKVFDQHGGRETFIFSL